MRILPKDLREKLREPIGDLVDEQGLLKIVRDEGFVVSVGDLVTYTLLKHGIQPVICIVDYLLKRDIYSAQMRETISQFGKQRVKVRNPPGEITDELWNAIQSAYSHLEKGPICIEIEGEEDLAALPAIYLAPSDVTVIYGLPNKGVVVVKATVEHKRKVKEVLDKM